MDAARASRRAQVAVSIGVLALGAIAGVVAFSLPGAGGYARIGPDVVPKAVAAGLLLLGAWLLRDALRGGWRAPVPDDPDERGDHAFVPSAFGWVLAGLVAQLALVRDAGFPIAAAALFACVARGFGSNRPLRDALVGLAIGVAAFLFFARLLGVGLPAGWLGPVLGRGGA
jgi:putative tricarboxylic transport membrane protein